MRKLSSLFKRTPFDDYDKFNNAPTVIKETTDLSQISDKEIVLNDKDLFVRKGNELQQIGGSGKAGSKGEAGKQGSSGTNGTSAFVYIAYASDASGTDFTMTFDSALDYIAILASATEITSPVVTDFTGLWKNYKGITGVGVPPGGTTGQILAKASNADYDTEWITP
jgi:hypothetical protein